MTLIEQLSLRLEPSFEFIFIFCTGALVVRLFSTRPSRALDIVGWQARIVGGISVRRAPTPVNIDRQPVASFLLPSS